MSGAAGHAARAFRRCWWAQTGHRSGCAHVRRSLQEARDHPVFPLDSLICTRGLGVGYCPGRF
eukprot:scaffold7857_cov75-Phaeocystis_antarctica.AAC.2